MNRVWNLSRVSARVAQLASVLGLLAVGACATPERRDDTPAPDITPAPDAGPPDEGASPPNADVLAQFAGSPAPGSEADPSRPFAGEFTTVEGPVGALTPEKQKLLDEYRALALKNDCSRGYGRLPGEWRFVGQTRTPNYASTITIDGTHFTERLSGNPDGKYVSATIEGEIRCAFKNRVLVTIDKVTPEGAYGNASGTAYPCDVLGDMDPSVERILMICYFDWDLRTAAGYEYEYERVEKKPLP